MFWVNCHLTFNKCTVKVKGDLSTKNGQNFAISKKLCFCFKSYPFTQYFLWTENFLRIMTRTLPGIQTNTQEHDSERCLNPLNSRKMDEEHWEYRIHFRKNSDWEIKFGRSKCIRTTRRQIQILRKYTKNTRYNTEKRYIGNPHIFQSSSRSTQICFRQHKSWSSTEIGSNQSEI